jgi:hypothetical protein
MKGRIDKMRVDQAKSGADLLRARSLFGLAADLAASKGSGNAVGGRPRHSRGIIPFILNDL